MHGTQNKLYRMRVYAEVCLTEEWCPNDGIEVTLVWV